MGQKRMENGKAPRCHFALVEKSIFHVIANAARQSRSCHSRDTLSYPRRRVSSFPFCHSHSPLSFPRKQKSRALRKKQTNSAKNHTNNTANTREVCQQFGNFPERPEKRLHRGSSGLGRSAGSLPTLEASGKLV